MHTKEHWFDRLVYWLLLICMCSWLVALIVACWAGVAIIVRGCA